MSVPSPEALLGVLTELERVRAAVLELLERTVPPLHPAPDENSPARTLYELLVGARRAVLGNPAAAREVYDLLVREGRRYATTEAGAALRDRLVAAEAIGHLRRVWETVSLNALEGPVSPSGVPDAWAELLADVVAGRGLDESPDETVLARLRPEGLA
jgi:hypothetical protein